MPCKENCHNELENSVKMLNRMLLVKNYYIFLRSLLAYLQFMLTFANNLKINF